MLTDKNKGRTDEKNKTKQMKHQLNSAKNHGKTEKYQETLANGDTPN